MRRSALTPALFPAATGRTGHVGLAVLLGLVGLVGLVALTACTAPDTEPPPAPTGLTAQAGSATSVHVMWDAPADRAGVTRYQVFEGGRLVRELPAEKTMVDITGLAPKTGYSFTVRAEDAAGNLSGAGPAALVTTPEAKAEDRTAPTAPAATTARATGPRSARLSWEPSTDDTGVTAYDVYQGGVRIHTAGAGEKETTLTGLRPDTVYTFTVRARDGADNSSPDGPAVDVGTPPASGDGPPTAPADLTATASPGTVTLTWTAPDTGRATTEYELYVNGRPTTVIQFGAGAVPAGRVEHRLTVAEPTGTEWSVKLRARLPDGNWGAFSAERRITLVA